MIRFCTSLLLFSIALIPAASLAQSPLQGDTSPLPGSLSRLQSAKKIGSLAGLSAAELSSRLGEADTVVRNEVNEQEKWSYGESSIFLSKGKVTVWIDQGELYDREQRQKLTRDKPAPDEGMDPFQDEWVNPWTPRKSVPKPDIVPDILDEQ